MRVVRAKLTEEVNSRLVSFGVDPLKSRLPRNVYQKQRIELQQLHEGKIKVRIVFIFCIRYFLKYFLITFKQLYFRKILAMKKFDIVLLHSWIQIHQFQTKKSMAYMNTFLLIK